MSDPAPELYSELKVFRHFAYPSGERLRHWYLIKGAVEFDAVEKRGVVGEARAMTESFRECLFIWNRQHQTACPGPEPGDGFCVHIDEDKQMVSQPILNNRYRERLRK
jgi:hypothetical protein